MIVPAFKTLRVAALAAILSAPVMAAAPAPQDVVNARVAGFKKMGGAMKAIGDQVKSGTPDKAATLAAAQTLATTAKGQGKLFPAGTGPAAGVKTDALPAIWTNRATFDAAMAKLVGESNKLVAVAGSGDAAAIGAQMKAVGAACGACHRQFRSDD
ncbi:cytochrome c [Sphingomonas sp. NFR15]|uniref:c-type cytochrome n=1 Tax=Sphingomonas sp. NFR15 TaxID=1566282 RepID=UPI0008890974|nr:cytochrome c [Sphingomonas sp. NFR15]SDA21174.1 Cytochrome c556 [Sphingomonas sp. NFR15]